MDNEGTNETTISVIASTDEKPSHRFALLSSSGTTPKYFFRSPSSAAANQKTVIQDTLPDAADLRLRT